jgi:pyruvate/2-oxoacid:ferredoxin oxidoreductase beta subunit
VAVETEIYEITQTARTVWIPRWCPGCGVSLTGREAIKTDEYGISTGWAHYAVDDVGGEDDEVGWDNFDDDSEDTDTIAMACAACEANVALSSEQEAIDAEARHGEPEDEPDEADALS